MVTDADWSALDRELELWISQGLTLPLWWRDDDAVAPTPQLTQLIDQSQALGLPVHLAVVPANAQPNLAEVVDRSGCLVPVVHGWRHQSHSSANEKKAEFGAHRTAEAMTDDLRSGLSAMKSLFGPSLRMMFVPPWNRMDPNLRPVLADLGYASLSTFQPRAWPGDETAPRQINTHLDPIDWRGTRSVVDPQTLIAQVARDLKDRRSDATDPVEPYGILTHHLVHDAAIWDFTVALLSRLLNGPAVPWTHPISSKDLP